jgi:hypothetical protein
MQDKLMKRSGVKLSQGIIGLFTRLCAYGKMIVELTNSPLPCNSCDALLAEINLFGEKILSMLMTFVPFLERMMI